METVTDGAAERSDAIRPNEKLVPTLPCAAPEETEEFYTALGFTVAYRQRRPYLYLAFSWSGIDVHYFGPPKVFAPENQDTGGCLVMVDAVAPYHAAFVRAMRGAYGKVLAKGCPRITRLRPGASRFTLVDPSGNSLIFIQRDEPQELEYGGSKELEGLQRALDNARILREFKNDDRAAMRSLVSALRRRSEGASDVDRALVYATLIELAVALGEHGRRAEWEVELRRIDLDGEERDRVREVLANVDASDEWFGGPGGEAAGAD
ncbi:VOC family protein [Nocardiopsis suaedae]|uniref:Glyoxalase n=1 Tax=Nocardiopsis suaedae TaxID=3018444 RepID=A0ABT4TKA8_9ACTN|nr:glyoxalase [Nocardiopsis suaedae]MDA2804816.1 glyoxalase [Nocardiopsis suaedae]